MTPATPDQIREACLTRPSAAAQAHLKERGLYASRHSCDFAITILIREGKRPTRHPGGYNMAAHSHPKPEDFAETQAGKTLAELSREHGVGKWTIKKWLAEDGLDVTRLTGNRKALPRPSNLMSRIGTPHATALTIRYAGTEVERAAEVLRRYGPVYRAQGGGGWWRGSTRLTDAEIIERAERMRERGV